MCFYRWRHDSRTACCTARGSRLYWLPQLSSYFDQAFAAKIAGFLFISRQRVPHTGRRSHFLDFHIHAVLYMYYYSGNFLIIRFCHHRIYKNSERSPLLGDISKRNHQPRRSFSGTSTITARLKHRTSIMRSMHPAAYDVVGS